MTRLYMDVQIPRAITDGLRARGVDVLTAQEDGSDDLPDPQLLNQATSLGRVLVSFDKHFLTEGALRQTIGMPFGGILFARQNRLTIGEIIDELELAALAGEPEDFANDVRHLPLR